VAYSKALLRKMLHNVRKTNDNFRTEDAVDSNLGPLITRTRDTEQVPSADSYSWGRSSHS
jgi:hypothetical protein